MKSKETRSEKVTVRLTPTVKAKLENRSSAQRRDLSDYVRLLIEEDLESDGKESSAWTS